MLFSVSLAKKYGSKGLTASSLHPGAIPTNLGRHMDPEDLAGLIKLDKELGNYEGEWTDFPWKTLSQGTATHVFAAFDPNIAEHNGAYCIDVRLGKPGEIRNKATDPEDAERLWKMSNEILGQEF